MKMNSRIVVLMMAVMSVAMLFGCATSGMDAGVLDPNLVRTNDLNLWEDAGWSELTAAEQELWKVLGWDEASWEGEAKQPASEDKYWKALTDMERMAAEKLGYTQETWDEE